MELKDIAPLETWAMLEKEAFKTFNLQSAVFNTKGIRITNTKDFANALCPKIKSTDKGQTFICATAHMNMANQAQQSKKAVIGECDAGLAKIVVPIFFKDEFVGAAGGCGILLEDGEVDGFAINKLTEIPDQEIAELSKDIPMISKEEAENIAGFFNRKIETFCAEFVSR